MSFQIDRRAALAIAAAGLMAAAFPARALTQDEAASFLRGVADELEDILEAATPQNKQVDRVLALLRQSAALPQIAQFTMGVNWRMMSDDQRTRFIDAFENYAARQYADNFESYTGQTFDVVGTQDAGSKGVVVRSEIRGGGGQDIRIDWLISDRGGRPQIVDVVAEGVSLSITQREEFASMVERYGGDFDRFIDAVNGGA